MIKLTFYKHTYNNYKIHIPIFVYTNEDNTIEHLNNFFDELDSNNYSGKLSILKEKLHKRIANNIESFIVEYVEPILK